jgi:hypothetical protein
MRRALIAAIGAAALVALPALVLATPAQAAEKALWYDDTYDAIARTISGVGDMRVLLEDDANEWATLGGTPDTLGFVCITARPGHWCYHRIFIAPTMSAQLGLTTRTYWWDQLGNTPAPSYESVYALIAFVHESYHYRLFSGDESRVQACTIRDLPHWLETQFHVPRTVQQTQTVPQTTTRDVRQAYRVRKWVRRNGKRVRVWVTRYRWVTVSDTTYVEQTVTVPNPVFTGVVSRANAIHAAEQPPYGGGTCF